MERLKLRKEFRKTIKYLMKCNAGDFVIPLGKKQKFIWYSEDIDEYFYIELKLYNKRWKMMETTEWDPDYPPGLTRIILRLEYHNMMDLVYDELQKQLILEL